VVAFGSVSSVPTEIAMIARCWVLLAAFLLLASGKDDMDKLQGEWTVASMDLGGKAMGEEQRKDWRLVVTGDEWLQKSNRDNLKTLKMTFQVDPAKNPKEIDFKWTEPGGKEWTLKGIYQLDGDTLTVCKRNQDNEDRPKEFQAGATTLLAVYKRAEKK
jgi:uncharacterized protein (TIGR03067 family)